MRVFCDLDGTLADFDRAYFEVTGQSPRQARDQGKDLDWAALMARPNFYANIEPMAGMEELWSVLRPYKPTILTGIPKSMPTEAIFNKREWVDKWIGSDVPIVTCLSSEKCLHGRRGDLLIDDWERYRPKWELMGGIWITFRNSGDAVVQFRQLMERER